jgi:hypothetical protein
LRKSRAGIFYERSGDRNPMWGKKHSPETITLLKERAKGRGTGKTNSRAKPVYQYDEQGNFLRKWEFAKECVDFYKEAFGINISRGNLSAAAQFNTTSKEKYKKTKGFIFSFVEIKTESL